MPPPAIHPGGAPCVRATRRSSSGLGAGAVLRWVQSIAPWRNEGYRVTLRDGHSVEVSRRQAKLLRERLEI